MGKTRGRINLGRNQEFYNKYVKFKMRIRHASGDSMEAVGYRIAVVIDKFKKIKSIMLTTFLNISPTRI